MNKNNVLRIELRFYEKNIQSLKIKIKTRKEANEVGFIPNEDMIPQLFNPWSMYFVDECYRYIVSRNGNQGKIPRAVPELKCRYRMMNECWTKVILVDRFWCDAIFVLQVINWNVTLDGRWSPNFVWRRCSVLSMMKQNRPYWKLAWKAGPRRRGVRRPDPVVFWRNGTRVQCLRRRWLSTAQMWDSESATTTSYSCNSIWLCV